VDHHPHYHPVLLLRQWLGWQRLLLQQLWLRMRLREQLRLRVRLRKQLRRLLRSKRIGGTPHSGVPPCAKITPCVGEKNMVR